jgi:hypothetical protein
MMTTHQPMRAHLCGQLTILHIRRSLITQWRSQPHIIQQHITRLTKKPIQCVKSLIIGMNIAIIRAIIVILMITDGVVIGMNDTIVMIEDTKANKGTSGF